jgi:hypothetical protein
MAKRSIDTWQDIISAERLAAERSAAKPRHIPPSGADAGRDRLIETYKPERERVWDARPALREIWTHGRQGRVDGVATPARPVRRPRD